MGGRGREGGGGGRVDQQMVDVRARGPAGLLVSLIAKPENQMVSLALSRLFQPLSGAKKMSYKAQCHTKLSRIFGKYAHVYSLLRLFSSSI
jgi:hypothetical protein